jgi:hypothetical protein
VHVCPYGRAKMYTHAEKFLFPNHLLQSLRKSCSHLLDSQLNICVWSRLCIAISSSRPALERSGRGVSISSFFREVF